MSELLLNVTQRQAIVEHFNSSGMPEPVWVNSLCDSGLSLQCFQDPAKIKGRHPPASRCWKKIRPGVESAVISVPDPAANVPSTPSVERHDAGLAAFAAVDADRALVQIHVVKCDVHYFAASQLGSPRDDYLRLGAVAEEAFSVACVV